MRCPTCHAENRKEAQFCKQCGGRLEISCPACKKANLPGSKFCDACGHALKGNKHTPPVDPSKAPAHSAMPPGSDIPPSRSSPQGERKHVTVLFSDLSGYTAMAEKLDPEEVKEITSRIFGEVAAVVARYDGFVEKYIGDAVVAVFGIPNAHEDDHFRAVRAAREIHEIVNAQAGEYEEKIGRRLTFHTGIATGLVVSSGVDLEKGAHGLIGDTINLASRLSDLAAPGEILVGESTYLASKGRFSFERLQRVSVKGKAETITPYRLRDKTVEPRGLATQPISSPLVGRTAEVAAIRGCVNRLLDGQGGILSLIGEAGLGKSRLMTEIRHAFAQENLLWLEGKTLSYGQKMSYWPFREILWQYTSITDDDSDTEVWRKFEGKIVDLFPAESGEIIPYLARLIGLEVKGDLVRILQHLDGEATGKQIYLSSRRFFERLAQKPLVLLFEDLHWADESTVLLIEHLFPLVNRVPLLICGVARPEADAPAARLRDTALKDYERRYTEIRLNPLSPTECTDLMNNLLNIENLPPRTRQLILQKAEGNPFFVEEIMRTLLDRGAVRYENGHWKATSRIETITIPNTIQGVIMARIDRLDDEVKQVLEAASVIGRAFLYRLLKKVTEPSGISVGTSTPSPPRNSSGRSRSSPSSSTSLSTPLSRSRRTRASSLRRRLELHAKVASGIEALFPKGWTNSPASSPTTTQKPNMGESPGIPLQSGGPCRPHSGRR